MLNAEEAGARLDSLSDPGWRAKAEQRAARLAPPLRRLAGALLEPEPRVLRRDEDAAYHARYRAVALELDGLCGGDRLDLTAALHPQLSRALARWWVDGRDQPYADGYARRAFRAPGDPALTREFRLGALRRAVEAAGPYPYDAAWLAAWAPHLPNAQQRDFWTSHFVGAEAGALLAAASSSTPASSCTPSTTAWPPRTTSSTCSSRPTTGSWRG